MFSSITSYLFGATEPETQEEVNDQPETTQEPPTTESRTSPTLKTVPTEDEWILVEKSGSSKMETSSMENLLIEHPSMSVYHHRGRQSSTGVDSEHSESSEDGESSENAMNHPSNQAGLARHQPPHRPRALASRIGLVEAKTVKSMQRAQKRHSHKELSKNNLRRVNHTQGSHTHKHLVQQPRRKMATNTKQQ